MVLNTLCFAFVSAFIVVVVIGHAPLAAAIWPKFFDGLRVRWLRSQPVASDNLSDAAKPSPAQPKTVISNKVAA